MAFHRELSGERNFGNTARLREESRAVWVSGEAFRALGVFAHRGRLLHSTDDQRGCAPNAVISHGLCQRAFGGRDSVVGAQMLIRG